MPRAPRGPKWSLMFMDLVLPWGCLDNRVVGGTEPGRGAIPDIKALGRPGRGRMSTGFPAPRSSHNH